MKTLDLASDQAAIEHILSLAEQQCIIARSVSGNAFLIAQVPAQETGDDDSAHEVALTRANSALLELPRERSEESAAYTLTEVREKPGLS